MYSKHTQIFGILGYPLGHTLSPWIHNTLFQLSKFDGVYLVFENPNWHEIGLGAFTTLGVRGLSVTIPYKEWAYTQATKRCRTSQTMRSANTLVFQEGIQAFNTDGLGAVRSVLNFDKGLLNPMSSDKILVLGSGGSAKGILFEISETLLSLSQGKPFSKKVEILARNKPAVAEIIHSLGSPSWLKETTYESVLEDKSKYSLVLHTTPIGMKGVGGQALLPQDFFTKNQTLFDIVYNPLETDLVKFAKKKKTNIIPGYHMLLHQGIRQFELFTGLEAKKSWIQKIQKILLSELKKRNL